MISRLLHWICDALVHHLYGDDALIFCPDRDALDNVYALFEEDE
jgi:hypothetical protein